MGIRSSPDYKAKWTLAGLGSVRRNEDELFEKLRAVKLIQDEMIEIGIVPRTIGAVETSPHREDCAYYCIRL